ncbi:MAG: RNase adapter RapZ [Oscillospiraceae bacterium]|nr:RNase adapter RapZ [Oscillospiraceae bacterium]
MEFVVVTGLSGGGKSRAVNVLEDFEFYCVDNMPVSMMPKFAELCLAAGSKYKRVAVVTDVRAITDFDELFRAFDEIEAMGCRCFVLFMEAQTETIIRRYKETRRPHPLDTEFRDLSAAVLEEQKLMQPLRNRADMIIDTTGLTVGMLRQKLYNAFMKEASWMPLTVTVSSFGFKYGLPIDADTVLDVRFLPNPYYVPELRERTGMDQDVYDYVFSHPDSQEYMTRLVDLFRFLLPRYITEGKTSFVVAVGCTGGHHRSVAVARKLAEDIRSMGYPVELYHRDIK